MRRPRSLGRWLTGWLAVLTLGGLGAVCIAIYVATNLSFVAKQEMKLQHRQSLVQHLLGEIRTVGDLGSLRHKLDDFFVGHAELALTLSNSDGTPIYTTTAASSPPEQQRRIVFQMPAPWASADMLQADLALDTSPDAERMRRLAWTLFASALAGAALLSAGGAWLVHRALLPVHDLVRQAAALNPETVGQPLDGANQALELQPLITQFNTLLARLAAAYQQLEGFNADVAHELRTPLATLIGESELALSRERDTNELRDVLGSNLEDLHRLTSLVNDMLFLSKADRGARARLAPAASLAALMKEVIDFHEAALHEAGLNVAVHDDTTGAFDAPLLRRAVSNLLANATRFAEPGSVIDVGIEAAPSGLILITVSNQGQTIAAEHLPRLFDRFYRVDKAREQRDSSHGLGLAIVSAIARMHGGAPYARSAAGKTTIGFSIPRGLPA